MKIYFALLLLGFVTYSTTTDTLDKHKCDAIAINLVKTKAEAHQEHPDREGLDKDNPNMFVGDFLKHNVVRAYVARASHREDLTDEKSSYFCSTITYVRNCGPVYYEREIIKVPTDYSKLKGEIITRTHIFSYHIPTKKLLGYTMIAFLSNEDDIILQVVKKSVKVYEADANGQARLLTDVPQEIIDAIAIEHALVYSNNDAMLSSSCEEDYAYASYHSDVVEQNKEGEEALSLEKALKWLDTETHTPTRENIFDHKHVKPVSTASFAGDVQQAFVNNVLSIKEDWKTYENDIKEYLEKQ